MPDLTERHYLLWLMSVKGLTNRKACELLCQFKTAEAVFNAPATQISAQKISPDVAVNLTTNRHKQRIYSLNNYLETIKMSYVTLADPHYPPLLREIYDAPVVLYYRGTLPDPALPCISVIGSRRPTDYGINAARMLSRDLARCGITIVSGMAEGLDAAAHEGALEANGITAAVLGGGADYCYPLTNRPLMERIIETGCVMSEHPPGTVPVPAYFVHRNRIISGLSHAVIVAEAGERSGTSITVNNALEQGRDVFAVPGSIFSKQSTGTNDMLKQCAYPVTTYKDVLYYLSRTANYEFRELPAEKSAPISTDGLSDNEKTVYNLVTHEAITIDELIIRTGFPTSQILVDLANLEFAGLLRRQPGQKYIRSI